MPLPFEDSRRLTGANLYFTDPGAVLETTADARIDTDLIARWRERVEFVRAMLHWPLNAPTAVRVHASGAAFAFAAPIDQLFTATEVNEWAFLLSSLPRTRSEVLSGRIREEHSFSHREKSLPRTRSGVPAGRMREAHSNSQKHDNQRKKIPFHQETLTFIRDLRRKQTPTEQLIWSMLRDRRMHGQKFRRQFAFDPYVLDFYCHDLKLAIEIDGGQHGDAAQSAHDAKRSEHLAAHGIHVLRYWNHDVQERTEEVLGDVWEAIDDLIGRVHEAGSPGEALPSSALRAPSPGGRRDERGATIDELFFAPAYPAIWDDALALQTLRLAAAGERRVDLTALLDAARARDLPFQLDDSELTLGAGSGARTWLLDALPAVDSIDWTALHGIPVALVTGSNGKTTTTRLVAAMSELHGTHTAFSCTDGVFVDGQPVASGDYSGPAGARTALRQAHADAAILETARGGILRRGLAINRADAAIVTNISADHFGEYGIHDLDGLADTKLVVARVLGAGAMLVLNADDEVLVRRAAALDRTIGWFALNADAALLVAHRQSGGTTCGVRAGELVLQRGGVDQVFGSIVEMPLTMHGAALYNVANIAGAVLLADAMGIPAVTIAHVLMHFGRNNADNPGRLMRWSFGSANVLLDYAHNPEGLRGLLEVAVGLRDSGRLALVLGQAGNREDVDIRTLAAAAAVFHPDLVVLKDIESHLRGRAAGEIAAILKDELLQKNIHEQSITTCLDEVEAVRTVLRWAHAGDVLVLPIHDKVARDAVVTLLDNLAASHWTPGTAVPAD